MSNLNKNQELFNIIKNNDEKELKKFIYNNINFNYNIISSGNIHLINYCILLNRVNMLKLLLKTNISLDIMDNEGKSILYNPIRFEYLDIINLLLENDNKIGLSICSIIDSDKLVALHYAIQFNQSKIFDLLIEKTNILLFDKDNNNFLQYAIQNQKINHYFIKKLILILNINYQNIKGETALHIACYNNNNDVVNLILDNCFKNNINELHINLNIQDNELHCTSLHYACFHNNINIVKRLIDNGADINIQEINGDTIFHYCIKFKNYNILHYLLTEPKFNNTINLNQYNINLNYPLHEIFLSINTNYSLYDKFNNYITLLINKTNLNFQNKFGDSCLHELCKYGIWKQYLNILKNKKLNILFKNIYGKTPLNYIQESDREIFINMVVESYINNLKKKVNDLKNKKINWINEFDKYCLNDENKCKEIIKNEINNNSIKSSIPEYKKEKYNLFDFINKYYINRDNVLNTSYIGLSIDILCGLKYLEIQDKKNNNLLKIAYDLENFDNLTCNFYNKNDLKIYNTFECYLETYFITWYNPFLYANPKIENIFNNSINDKSKRFIIIYLSLLDPKIFNKHANVLIYDKKTNEVERFDPYGLNLSVPFNFADLDKRIKQYFLKIDKNIKYISPKEYLNEVGLQRLDIEEDKIFIGDPSGFCVSWCIWYSNLRINNPTINRLKIIRYIIEIFSQQQLKYKNMIRNFSYNITKIRDEIFNDLNINLNDYYNEEIDEYKFVEIVNKLNKI
jgi:ankyrin repeat protein